MRELVEAAGEDPSGEHADVLTWLELGEDDRPFAAPVHWSPYVLYGG